MDDILELSDELIYEYQRKDKGFLMLIEMVPKRICPVRPKISLENADIRRLIAQWWELDVIDGILCRWKTVPAKGKVLQMVIPQALRKDILYYCHGHLFLP